MQQHLGKYIIWKQDRRAHDIILINEMGSWNTWIFEILSKCSR